MGSKRDSINSERRNLSVAIKHLSPSATSGSGGH